MALKMLLASLEGIDETIAAFYKEREGKYHLDVEGAFSQIDIDKLKKAANDEREVSKGLKAELAKWGDYKADETLPLLDGYSELKARAEAGDKKFDSKQIDELANARLVPVQRKLDEVTGLLAERDQTIADFKAKDLRRTIFDAVRTAATESKAKPDTFKDDNSAFFLIAERLFTVNEQGEVVVRDGVPNMLHGTRIKDAIPDLQKMHPYLWPESTGGGASGSKGGGPELGGNPFKGNNLQARSQYVRDYGDAKAEQAMKAAGLSTLWEMHPQK